jgi:hypothetical protein
MKAGKEWMLKEYLKDKGIADKPKDEAKPVHAKDYQEYISKKAKGEKILPPKEPVSYTKPDPKPDDKPKSTYKGPLSLAEIGDIVTYESSPGQYDKAVIDKLYVSGNKIGVKKKGGVKSILMSEDVIVVSKGKKDVPKEDPKPKTKPKPKVKYGEVGSIVEYKYSEKGEVFKGEITNISPNGKWIDIKTSDGKKKLIGKEDVIPDPKAKPKSMPKEGDKIDVTVSDKKVNYTGTVKKISPAGMIILDTDQGLIVVDPSKDKIGKAGSNQKAAEKMAKKSGLKKIYDFAKFERLDQRHKDVQRDFKHLTSMNSDDVSMLRYYTSNNYTGINGYLRTDGKMDTEEKNKKAAVVLDRILRTNAQPLSQDTLLFRRIGQGSIKHIFNDEIYSLVQSSVRGDSGALDNLKTKLIGGAIEDKAYMSTAHIEGSFGSSYDINIHIHAPKGYKGGMFIDSISQFRGEHEYLLNKGKKLNIHDIEIKDGRIFFKVVPDDV